MKLVQLFLVAVAVVCTANAQKQFGEDEKKMLRTQLSTCQKKEGVSEAEMNELFTGKNLQSDKAKCLLACALEQFTIIAKQSDGTYKMDVTNVVTMAAMIPSIDKKKTDATKKIAEACNKKVTSKERCQYASDLVICIIGEAFQAGLVEM